MFIETFLRLKWRGGGDRRKSIVAAIVWCQLNGRESPIALGERGIPWSKGNKLQEFDQNLSCWIWGRDRDVVEIIGSLTLACWAVGADGPVSGGSS